jgi:hypothetical protein
MVFFESRFAVNTGAFTPTLRSCSAIRWHLLRLGPVSCAGTAVDFVLFSLFMAAWVPPGASEVGARFATSHSGQRVPTRTQPGAIRRPLEAFIVWITEKREKVTGFSTGTADGAEGAPPNGPLVASSRITPGAWRSRLVSESGTTARQAS